MRQWACEVTDLPTWLVEDTYSVIGDLAETISLLTPEKNQFFRKKPHFMDFRTQAARKQRYRGKASICSGCMVNAKQERVFCFNKLITGGFRLGVSQKLTLRALAKITNIDEFELSLRLMGNWHPDTTTWNNLIINDERKADISRPYPFCLAYGLDKDPVDLGKRSNWIAEWKWTELEDKL